MNDNSHEANLRKAIRLIGKVFTLVADGWRISQKQEAVAFRSGLYPRGKLSLHAHRRNSEQRDVAIFDTALVLYADHEFNASTFAARVTASTLLRHVFSRDHRDRHPPGPSTAGPTRRPSALETIGSPERVETWVKGRLARKEKIMGFGHRVYRTGDSRVPVMREIARQLGERHGETQWVPICEKLEGVMAREKNLCANEDLYAAVVFRLLGLPAALHPAIFALSRIAGWCAHIIEQHDHNRLIRPRSIYTGPARRKLKS